MKMLVPIVAVAAMAPVYGVYALPYTGMYQTIDDATNSPKSVVMLYENDGKLAGRIVALYDADGKISETIANPVKVATKVKDAPKYAGLDIIWNMQWNADDNRYTDGKIMDPASGRVYSSVIWQDTDGQLSVRGKIGPIGRTQTWHKVDVATMPTEIQTIDTTNWKPLIRK